MYRATTRHIRVTVEPRYLDEESRPGEGRWVWAYAVEIVNMGPETVQLRTRFWQITDEHGRTQEVRGAGVVGEQPVLSPGESFRYVSGCPLETPSGLMVGRYGMRTEEGEAFEVAVPAFSLDSPGTQRTMN